MVSRTLVVGSLEQTSCRASPGEESRPVGGRGDLSCVCGPNLREVSRQTRPSRDGARVWTGAGNTAAVVGVPTSQVAREGPSGSTPLRGLRTAFTDSEIVSGGGGAQSWGPGGCHWPSGGSCTGQGLKLAQGPLVSGA